MRCDFCEWKYPEHYLSPMHVGGSGYTPPICAICALLLSNEISGVERDSFSGEGAETLRLAAIKWRDRHPADKPVVN